jgi:NAD(P)-dependent dehydrogenase (short-subunit alcohol dehydrogenase family)
VLDLLLVNAGIAGKQESRLSRITPEGFTEVMLVNALAPVRIADGFLDLVTRNGTIAVVSSGLGSIADNDSGGYEPYRMSKAALDMGLRSIAARDGARRRTFLAICPGWVSSDMGGPSAPVTPRQSARGIADMLAARQGSGGVAFVDHENDTLPW